MADTILGYSERALVERPDDPSIHAVRALGLVLRSPEELGPARTEVDKALGLAPDDNFLQQAKEYLDSIGRIPGTAPEPPNPEEFYDGPDPRFFESGEVLGSGDRGILVRALKQRLARVATLGFDDPGRYHDIFDEPTREAVLKLQVEADLPPTGLVNGPTWEALEMMVGRAAAAAPQPDTSPEPIPSLPTAHGDAGEPIVYLTFDDGPHPTWTPQVLEVLARHDAIATFFVLGASVTAYPELASRIVEAGHDAENHTFDHASLDRMDRATFIAEVEDTDHAIEEATGGLVDPTSCLRPPYGAVDAQTNILAAELGKEVVLWNVDPQDWRRPGATQIARHLIDNARPGAILLMHDGGGVRSQTVEALDTVLRELSERGYSYDLLCR